MLTWTSVTHILQRWVDFPDIPIKGEISWIICLNIQDSIGPSMHSVWMPGGVSHSIFLWKAGRGADRDVWGQDMPIVPISTGPPRIVTVVCQGKSKVPGFDSVSDVWVHVVLGTTEVTLHAGRRRPSRFARCPTVELKVIAVSRCCLSRRTTNFLPRLKVLPRRVAAVVPTAAEKCIFNLEI